MIKKNLPNPSVRANLNKRSSARGSSKHKDGLLYHNIAEKPTTVWTNITAGGSNFSEAVFELGLAGQGIRIIKLEMGLWGMFYKGDLIGQRESGQLSWHYRICIDGRCGFPYLNILM
jgi:hypothetical protein